MNIQPKLGISRRGAQAAFSLVEVALAIGIVSFGLVGVLGTFPIALTSARESIAQTRSAELASSLFASFRAQPFNKVCYVDAQFGADGVTPSGSGPVPIDLQVAQTPANPNDDFISRNPQNSIYNADNQYLRFFASIDQIDPADGSIDPARVHYSIQAPSGGGYQIILHFTSAPDGTSGNGIANRVEMLVSEVDHPVDYYRFTSTIANRSGLISLAGL